MQTAQLADRTRRRTRAQMILYEMGLTHQDVAERSGLSAKAVGDAVCGRRFSPRTQTLIAHALGMTPEGLFGDDTHPRVRRGEVAA